MSCVAGALPLRGKITHEVWDAWSAGVPCAGLSHANKAELLAIPGYTDITLHTNDSENDIRCQVTKRKITPVRAAS
jgi:hypothetical protein